MAFTSAVEQWRDLANQLAGDVPVDYILAHIYKESGGNPCDWTKLNEVGIGQLMPPDNITQAGTTYDAQHPSPPCVAGTRTIAYRSDLTDAQAYEQMRATVQFINWARDYAHQKLIAAGQDWSEGTPDFWSLVKVVHILPSAIASTLARGAAALGRPVANWDEFKQYTTMPAKWTAQAEWVGSYAADGPSAILDAENVVFDVLDTSGDSPNGLSGWEIALVALASIAGLWGALRLDRWIHAGKPM